MTSFKDVIQKRVDHVVENRHDEPIRVSTPSEMSDLRAVLGLRPDWHEPDEQGVDAIVFGGSFDNAGFWGSKEFCYDETEELHVVFYFEGYPVAAVNLASLCAWGSAYGSVIGD